MFATAFAAGMFQTNCYVLAPDAARGCIVVDPGQDAVPTLRSVLDRAGLTPEAVLLTHGHLDHTWSVAEVCDSHGIPVYVHPEDRYMLSDPGRGIGPALGSMIGDIDFREPASVVELTDGEVLDLAGMSVQVLHTPGHTQGSVVFRLTAGDGPDDRTAEVLLTGDTLFEGSIGRSDLPGGDHEQLLRSIADRLLVLPDETPVAPGHGSTTTIGRERSTNPFLTGLRR